VREMKMDLEKFTHYCIEYADVIFVREKIDGRWQNVALGTLSEKKQMEWIQGWYDENRTPVRMLREKT